MAENSGISWTDHTFNPWMGCTKVSPACKNCYAERDMDHRYGKVQWGPSGNRVLTSGKNWMNPLKWNRMAQAAIDAWSEDCAERDSLTWPNKPRRPRVFCSSLADVFEDWQGPMFDHKGNKLVVDKLGDVHATSGPTFGCVDYTMKDARERLFQLIDATPNLDWLLLTKRPENIVKMWPETLCDGRVCDAAKRSRVFCPNDSCDVENGVRQGHRSNVWLGTSVENSDYLHRIDSLKACGDLASVLFISAEPLLGDIPTLGEYLDGIDWVIAGGESGPGARELQANWFRSIRDQCQAAGVAFHFKQWGEWLPDIQNPTMDTSSLPSDCTFAIRVGTKKAGRLLDGVLHDAFPEVDRG